LRSALVAEWLLSRFTSSKRAASVVGDLVELKLQKGSVWFWLSIARVLVSLSWRRVAALIAAFYVGAWAYRPFEMAIIGINTRHRPPSEMWVDFFLALSALGALLLMAFTYAAIRYGLRDRVTQLAMIWAGLVAATIVCWWQPAVLVVCIGLSVCMAVHSSVRIEDRKATLVLIVTVVAGFASYLLALYVASRYQHFVFPRPMGSKEVQEHPSIVWVAFCVLLMAAWNTTTACSRMHDWISRNRLGDLADSGR
jgi:hypothetical protein